MIIGEALVKFTSNAEATVNALKSVGNAASDVQKKTVAANKTLSTSNEQLVSMSKSVVGGFGNMIGAVVKYGAIAGAGLLAAGGFAVKSAADIQMLRTNLDTLTGSAENGQKMFKNLYDYAAKTPFELPDITKATQTLLSYGTTQEQIMPTIKMLGDISLGNKDKLQMLSLAFGQVQAKGRLMGQELLQMTDNGFNPLQIISQQTGRSMLDLTKAMEKGEISVAMVEGAMKTATSEGGRFYQGTEKGAQTITGLFSTLKDTVGMAARSMVGLNKSGEIVQGGIIDKLSKGLQQLIKWFNENQATVDKFAKIVGTVLITTLEILGNTLIWLVTHWKLVAEIVIPLAVVALGVLAAALYVTAAAWWALNGAIIVAALPFILIGAAIAALVALIVFNWEWVKSTSIAVWNAIKDFFKKHLELIVGIILGPIALLVLEIVKHWDDIKSGTVNAWNAIAGFFTGLWASITNGFQTAVRAVSGFFTALWNDIVNIWNAIVAFLSPILQTIFNILTLPMKIAYAILYGIVYGIYEFFKWIWSMIGDSVMAALNAIKDFIVNTFNTIQTFLTTVWTAIAGFFTAQWEIFKAAIIAVFTAISNFVMPIWTAFTDALKAVWNAIADFFAQRWENLKTNMTNAFNAIKNVVVGVWNTLSDSLRNTWNTITNWVGDKASAAGNAITSPFEKAKNAVVGFAKGIYEGISDWFGKIGGAIKGPINNLIDGINKIINGYNKLPGTPDLPTIPRFAQGVKNFMGGLAIVGEHGEEMVQLPTGSNVYSAADTKKMLQGNTTTNQATKVEKNKSVNFYGPVYNNNGETGEKLGNDINRQFELAEQGVF
jgi:tape measure domain-containing protein